MWSVVTPCYVTSGYSPVSTTSFSFALLFINWRSTALNQRKQLGNSESRFQNEQISTKYYQNIKKILKMSRLMCLSCCCCRELPAVCTGAGSSGEGSGSDQSQRWRWRAERWDDLQHHQRWGSCHLHHHHWCWPQGRNYFSQAGIKQRSQHTAQHISKLNIT